MKKFYMFLAAGLAAFSANADLHFYIHGNEVENGSRVDISSYYEDQEYQFMVDPEMEIKADEDGAFSATVKLTQGSTIPEYDWDYGAEVNALWCAFDGQCVPLSVGKSANKSASLTAGKAENMQLEISGSYGDKQDHATLVVKAECTVNCTFAGKNYSLTLFVDHDPSGVNDIAFDSNAPVEYYDLQGRRVNNPSNGLYIMRQGSKVVKSIIK
ncbi:MAG: hypothetical protein K2G23_11475 [Muribaculaceae bacterium]|nr:hypothetical protein [Muribaculaceae bacterium]